MKNILVKKHNDLINSRYSLSEIEIKIVSILISMIQKDDIDFHDYVINIDELQELTNVKSVKNNAYYIQISKDLMKKTLVIENDASTQIFNWVSFAEHTKNTSILTFNIHKKLRSYLIDLRENYLSYDIRNILNLKSSYVIRLYELLIKEFNEYKHYNKNAHFCEIVLNIEHLKNIFEIPASQTYHDIKRHILLKAQEQFQQKTNIIFSFDEIKENKKVVSLKIKIYENNSNLDYLKDLNTFISYMRKNYINKDVYNAQNMIISISEKGFLYNKKNLKEYQKKDAKLAWQTLYKLAQENKLLCLKQQQFNF